MEIRVLPGHVSRRKVLSPLCLDGSPRSRINWRGSDPRPPGFEPRTDIRPPPSSISKTCLCTRRSDRPPSLRTVLCDGVFVHFDNLDELITLLHGHPNFIYDPRTCEGPLRNSLVSAFAIRVALDAARPSQAEHQPAFTAIWQHWMVEFLGRWDATFY